MVQKSPILIINAYAVNGVGGGGRATRGIVQACARGLESGITIVSDTLPKGWSVNAESRFITVSKRTWWQKAKGVLCLRSLERFSPLVDLEIERFARDIRVVVLNGSILGRLAPLFRARGVRVVTVHHNIESSYYRENTRNRILAVLLSEIASRNQRLGALQSDLNVALSKHDASRLISEFGVPKEKVCVMRPFDPEEVNPRMIASRNVRKTGCNLRLVTTGSLALPQTISGVMWLVKCAMPALSRMFPDVHLIVAGSNPAQDLASVFGSACTVVPNPTQEEIDKLVDCCDIFICPTSGGSGVKYKVLDGLRRGIPVVAHKNACEGYDDAMSEAILQYSDVETFCESISCALHRIGSSEFGYREVISCYLKNYSFQSGVKFWKCIMSEMLPPDLRKM